MNLELLNRVTREQISQLHPLSKREFVALTNNFLTVVIGNADNIQSGAVDPNEGALAIAKAARRYESEIAILFAERAPETTGAQEKA